MTRTLFLFLLSLTLSAQAADPHPSVRLNWQWSQGAGDAATGFHVQRSAIPGGPYTVVGTVPAGTLTYLDTTVIAGGTYYYVVTAYNAGGDSSKSAEVSCTVPFQAPASPSGLSAVTQ